MAPVMAEWMSASVAAMTRAAKVRSVELVVGVEDESDVEGAVGGVGGLLAVEHPEEIGGVGKRLVGFDDGLAFADAIEDGDDHGDLRGEAEGFADVGVVIVAALRRRRRTTERRRRCAGPPWARRAWARTSGH